MKELIRRRWSKKYINCWEDKRDYDIRRRGLTQANELIAAKYCEKFSPPELTPYDKKEISEYWAQYGIKIYDFDWHRMYYHVTNTHDPHFIPDLVVGFVLYEYYNDHVYEDAWRDKNMFHRLLPEVPLPRELGKCIRGRYFHEKLGALESITDLSYAVWESMDYKSGDIIIKNARETGFGKSVSKYFISKQLDIVQALEEWKNSDNYIIQACVYPHNTIASLNPASSNMIRVCSWRHGNEVDIMYAAARVGVGDSYTDISFANGEELVNLVGISKDGYFANHMVDQYGRHVKKLPENVKVPAWNKIVEIIKKNHILMDNFDLVGWDFTVDENENPVCFEWNIRWPGTILYQYANGQPLYGDKTDEILSFLKNEKNRDNYIPFYMRAK